MEPLTPADCHILIHSQLALSPDAYTVVKKEFQPLDTSGFSVFSDLNVLRLSVKLRSSGEVSELSFIIKTPPQEKTCASFVSAIRAFYKEPKVYCSILKDFSNQVSGKIGPSCFLSVPDKIIVLDNILDLGFKKVDLNTEFNLHHCELVLEALAKLHASSLVLEEIKKKKIPELYPDVLFETVYSDETDHPGFEFMCTGINSLETLVLTHFTHFPKNIIKETITQLRNLPFKLKPSQAFRNVLNHGGVWSENALFSYGTDNNPTDVHLIDFSQARYAPPACDILLFLHLSTSRAFRELHKGALLTHYYSKLAKEVQAKGLDLGELIPWVEFEASCQYYMNTAITAGLLHLHVHLLPTDTLNAVTRDPANLKVFKLQERGERVMAAYASDESYRRRLSQALVQALEFTQFRGRRRSSVYIAN